jgi:hypothetical protein
LENYTDLLTRLFEVLAFVLMFLPFGLGMATTRDSTKYSNLHVKKYITDVLDGGGRPVFIPFEHTIVSGETGGASAGVHDRINLCVLPAKCMVIGLSISMENLWASAGANGTFQLGDSGDDDRYMLATESYTATGGPTATDNPKTNILPHTGQNYRTTGVTTVFGTYKVANPTVGKTIKGGFWVIESAGP